MLLCFTLLRTGLSGWLMAIGTRLLLQPTALPARLFTQIFSKRRVIDMNNAIRGLRRMSFEVCSSYAFRLIVWTFNARLPLNDRNDDWGVCVFLHRERQSLWTVIFDETLRNTRKKDRKYITYKILIKYP